MKDREKFESQMIKKTFTLIKLSSPDFELNTEHIYIVHDILNNYVCKLCKSDGEDWPENYNDLPIYEKINVLLTTSCGAEFLLEET